MGRRVRGDVQQPNNELTCAHTGGLPEAFGLANTSVSSHTEVVVALFLPAAKVSAQRVFLAGVAIARFFLHGVSRPALEALRFLLPEAGIAGFAGLRAAAAIVDGCSEGKQDQIILCF